MLIVASHTAAHTNFLIFCKCINSLSIDPMGRMVLFGTLLKYFRDVRNTDLIVHSLTI